MQSLTELNNYSNTSVSYVDLRPPEIKFDRQVPTNQSTSAIETKSFTYQAQPGVEIVSLVTNSASYSIDLTNNTSCSVTWSTTLPPRLTVSNTGGIFTVGGITTLGDWELVRAPTISGTMRSTPFTFTSTVGFNGSNTSWTTAVSVISLNELSTPTADATYASGVSSLVAHTPLVVDNVPGMDTNAYVMTISADDNTVFGSLSTSGSLGGTSVFSNNQLVISGSLDQVNSHLLSLRYTSPVDLNQTWILTYSLFNPAADHTSVAMQYINSNVGQFFSTPSATTYDKNNLASVLNAPSILSTVTTAGTYRVDVIPSVSVFFMSSLGDGSSTWETNQLTITGTKDQVNSHLSTISFQPDLNRNTNFVFRYKLTTPDSIVVITPQMVLINNANALPPYLELSEPAASIIYVADESTLINNPPQIVSAPAPFNTNSYSLVLSTSRLETISLMSSSGTGGTSTFNSTTKTLTIVGTASQINSHLLSTTFTSPIVNNPFTLTYTLHNPSADFYSIKTQVATDASAALFVPSTDSTYDKNVSKVVSGNPLLIDSTITTGELTMTVYSNSVGGLEALSSSGTGGTSTFNSTTKTLTIVGTKDQINSHLNSITMQPGLDYSSMIILKYRVTANTGIVGQVSQIINVGNLNTAITNITASRSFISNTSDQLILSVDTPQILETVDGASYTIYLSSPAGYFTADSYMGVVSNYSFTGSKAQVNALLGLIKFYPKKDVTGDQTLSYRQVRNGTQQVFQTIPLVGTNRTLPYVGATTTVYSTNSVVVLTYEQKNYLRNKVLVVGAGGGAGGPQTLGGVSQGTPWGLGGGGGGGDVLELDDVLISFIGQVTIGQGGWGGDAAVSPTTAINKNGRSGGVTTFTTNIGAPLVANGGSGGESYFYGSCASDGYGNTFYTENYCSGNGGASGNGYLGGIGGSQPPLPTGSQRFGGGGGGCRGAGGRNPSTSGGLPTHNTGAGGSGHVSTITGSTIEYGKGGGGVYPTVENSTIYGTYPARQPNSVTNVYGSGGVPYWGFDNPRPLNVTGLNRFTYGQGADGAVIIKFYS